jgi:hypothetical protein
MLKPISRLDCPASEGLLKLTNAAADGQTCAYTGDQGEDVQLKLVKVSDDPDKALDAIEADLKTVVPMPPSEPSPPPAPPAPGHIAEGDQHNVKIALPGLSIHAGEDKANIRVGGLHIDADDDNDQVHIEHGGRSQFSVDANHGGAIIRARRAGPDVRSTLILATDSPGPEGWHVAGYEARGPRSGPLVVAIVKSKADEHDRLFGDVKDLVRHSARG